MVRHSVVTSLKARLQSSGRWRRGGGSRGMLSRARMGCSACRGGAP